MCTTKKFNIYMYIVIKKHRCSSKTITKPNQQRVFTKNFITFFFGRNEMVVNSDMCNGS